MRLDVTVFSVTGIPPSTTDWIRSVASPAFEPVLTTSMTNVSASPTSGERGSKSTSLTE